MNIIRAKGIPIWITGLTILLGLAGTFLGLRALLDPTMAMGYMDGADTLAIAWGGRNAGLGVALLVAVLLRNASGYAAAFAGSLFREMSDILAMSGNGFPIPLGVFLLLEIVIFVICLRAAWQQQH